MIERTTVYGVGDRVVLAGISATVGARAACVLLAAPARDRESGALLWGAGSNVSESPKATSMALRIFF